MKRFLIALMVASVLFGEIVLLGAGLDYILRNFGREWGEAITMFLVFLLFLLGFYLLGDDPPTKRKKRRG